MEDIRLSLNDEYKVEDKLCPKGVVIIRDQDGNIIFKGNNMVVKSGRNLLFNLFLGTPGTKEFSDVNAFIGDNITMAAADDTYTGYTAVTSFKSEVTVPGTAYIKATEGSGYTQVSSINNDDFMVYYTNSTGTRLCPDANKLYYRTDASKLYIHMGINYTPSTTVTASTFGLFFGSDLFSRIVFPRRTLTANTPLIIDYYLYF
jgi:hypothetical protein